MYIDKSFQLLSAENGRSATDDARLPYSGEENTEFSELLDAEQVQKKRQDVAAGADKKAGQDFAALRDQKINASERQKTDIKPDDQASGLQSLASQLLEVSAECCNDNAAITAEDEVPVEATLAVTEAKGELAGVDNTDGAQVDADDTTVESPDHSNPWFSIIHLSKEFKSILSPPTKPVENDLLKKVSDPLLAAALELTNEAMNADDITVALDAGNQPAEASSDTGKLAEASKTTKANHTAAVELHGSAVDQSGAETQSPTASGIGSETDVAGSAIRSTNNQELAANRPTIVDHSNKLSSEQNAASELIKIDKADIATAVIGAERVSDSATQQQVVFDEAAKASSVSQRQVAQPQLDAGKMTSADSQTEERDLKTPLTALVDGEISIENNSEEKAPVVVTAGAASVTTATSAKNAPQSFAEFQKAANAAVALSRKQQQQNEQSQQPSQEFASQQPQRMAEFNPVVSLQQNESASAVFSQLPQMERMMSNSGSAMGSSTGQQQQQAATQLFATRLHESVANNEQPALSLLEPTAAVQLKERVMFQINQKIQSAEIKLAPEELGTMQIKVQLQQEQMSVQFIVQQAGAKEALEQQMPRLREMLEEQGIELSQGQVSQQGEGSDAQRQARERNQSFGHGSDLNEEPLPQQAMVRVSDRMVDYYA